MVASIKKEEKYEKGAAVLIGNIIKLLRREGRIVRLPGDWVYRIRSCKDAPVYYRYINLNVCHENDSEGYTHANFNDPALVAKLFFFIYIRIYIYLYINIIYESRSLIIDDFIYIYIHIDTYIMKKA